MALDTHPFSTEMKACPYDRYDEWRREAPLVWSPEIDAWLVTGYDEAKEVLERSDVFSSTNSVFGGPELYHPEFPSMINRDDPDHRKLRGLVAKVFTPRNIEEAWEPRIREVIDQLLDAVEARGDGRLDIVGDLAYPLPVQIIAEIIGIPSKDFEQFKLWSNQIVQDIGRVPEHGYPSREEAEAERERQRAERERMRQEALERGDEVGPEEGTLFAYFYNQIQQRRAAGSDDLVMKLVDAEIDGEKLTDMELLSFLVLLLVAGNETTTNLMNHCVRALTQYPDEQRKVRAHPELLPKFIEEALRWEAPIQGFYRRALQDTEVAGVQIKQYDALLVLYGAANRDPERYYCPAEFDVDRGERDHLAFGHGKHYCLGANLARLEATLAIQAVLERTSWLAPIPGEEVEWWDTPFFRGPKSYVVRWEPKRAQAAAG